MKDEGLKCHWKNPHPKEPAVGSETPTIDELDELSRKATQGEWSSPKPGWQPPESMGMRGQYPPEGWFPEHIKDYRLNSTALDSEEENGVAYQLDEVDSEFIAALVNYWRSGGAELVRDAVQDKARLDWLELRHVVVNEPRLYGSKLLFRADTDEDSTPSRLRHKIDAARKEGADRE